MVAIDSEHSPGRNAPVAERREADASATRERGSYRLPLIVLIVGLAVTAALALISQALYANNENRLLKLSAREASSVLTGSVPSIQTPLASAAELAGATNGNVVKFKGVAGLSAGPEKGKEFSSMSLWRVGSTRPLAVVGASPVLASMPDPESFIRRAAQQPTLSVFDLLQPPNLRLGYAFAAPGSRSGYVVYGETPLPSDRRSRIQNSSAFSNLNYAIYFGRTPQPSNLLLTSVQHLPFSGRTASDSVPFGDTALTLVVSPRDALAGALPERLPWLIAIVGILLTASASGLTLRLVERRRDAERLAGRLDRIANENRRLYAEQRDIAQTLQHALLPEALPRIPGAEASARYEAGEQGVEIGGDWYDVIALDERRLLLVVGDVSGHGLRAASTMASLRFAIHAYAAQGDAPSEILTKLSRLVNVSSTGHLATVLCMLVDVAAHKITVTSAGHLPPLLLSGAGGQFLNSEVGLPVGIDRAAAYTSLTVSAPPAATLIAFTDGLVERRGEHLDQGLERLRVAAVANHALLPELMQRLVREVRNDPAEDDTAIVGLRWTD